MKEEIIEKPDACEPCERIFKLLIDGKIVCEARTACYDLLLNITTIKGEERKGFGRKLLSHIEKVAKEHGAKKMETSDIDPLSNDAIFFFKSMGYNLKKMEDGFFEGIKQLDCSSI